MFHLTIILKIKYKQMKTFNLNKWKQLSILVSDVAKTALLACFLMGTQLVVAQKYTSHAYPEGNFIFCGEELPKKFSYLIERETGDGTRETIASLKVPESLNECNSWMLKLPRAIANITKLNSFEIVFVWKCIQKPGNSLDSLYAYSGSQRYQYMAGCGWFDDGIKTPGTYKYHVTKVHSSGKALDTYEVPVTFPPKINDITLNTVSYILNPTNVIINYRVSDFSKIAGIKLFRSPLLREDFMEILHVTGISAYKNEPVAFVRDENPELGMTYSYFAVPYDGLGNLGNPSDTINIYLVSKDADLGLITYFEVTSIPDKGGNMLKWNYDTKTWINLIEIYRSELYNDQYELVSTVSPNVREYFDSYDINPAKSYFYYIKLNDGLGNSIPSARFPAVLEGKKANAVEPQDLELIRNGNVVTLKFRPVGHDIRGAYVYRANGYQAPLEQLPRIVLSTDSIVTYVDTLPMQQRPEVYSYAVASVNISHNLSPMSMRVSTAYSGGILPTPTNLSGQLEGKNIWLVWTDVGEQNPYISSYQVFRRARYLDKEEPEQMIGVTETDANSFTDSLALPGRDYIYRVRSVGADSTDVSSFSLPFGIYTSTDAILAAGELSAIPSKKKGYSSMDITND